MELAKVKGKRCIGDLPDRVEIALDEHVKLVSNEMKDPARAGSIQTLTLSATMYVSDRALYLSAADLKSEINRELWRKLRRAVLDHE